MKETNHTLYLLLQEFKASTAAVPPCTEFSIIGDDLVHKCKYKYFCGLTMSIFFYIENIIFYEKDNKEMHFKKFLGMAHLIK